ncbi:MAG: hypothetical protein NTV31_11635 [Bacteroidia bacterium]|nr:hypothetical protein [Bacteroidia bacterium]
MSNVTNENESNNPFSYINPPEFKKLNNYFCGDVWKEFQDAGNIVSWVFLEPDHMVLVHIIQPNRLHCLGRYDSETNILKTVVKDLTKEQIIKYLKENTNVKDPSVRDYDELGHSDDYEDL